MARINIGLQMATQFKTIHIRHHHVTDNHIHSVILNHGNSFYTIVCQQDFMAVRENTAHYIQ